MKKRTASLVVALCVSLMPAAALAFEVSGALEQGGVLILAFVFAQGLLTALTPCVYPLIPITVSIFGAREASRLRAAQLSATYVVGIALMFSSLGVIVARTGGLFGQIVSNIWVVGGAALVFALFAASMFGAFEIALPYAMQERLTKVGGKGYVGAFGMGLVAGLIAAPCAGPVVGGVLTYVALKGSMALGFGLLFVYGVGLGLPFFLVGAFSMTLPKSGPWLDGVKSVLGIMLLATALYLLKDALPLLKEPVRKGAAFVLGALCVAGVGVTLGAVHRSFHGTPRDRLLKAVGVGLAVIGSYGAAASATLPPEEGLPVSGEIASGGGVPGAPGLKWIDNEAEALAEAKAEGKPVLVDFWANWCEACKELDHKTYPKAAFQQAAERFVLLKIDCTEGTDEIDEITDKYGVLGLPTVAFVGRDGKVLEQPRALGFIDADAMVAMMEQVR